MNYRLPERPLRTLRRRLLFFLLLPLGALLTLSLTADFHIAYEPANEAFDHALTDDVVALGGRVHVVNGRLEVDLPPAAEAVLRYGDGSDEEFLAVYGPDSRLLAGDTDLKPASPLLPNHPLLTDGELHGKRIRKASYLLETDAGPVSVAVAETTRKRERSGSKILAAMILPNVLLIVATLALVYFGVRRGLAPLTHLSEEISRRSPHDLSPLPQGEVPGEAEPLVKAMDGLVADLRAATVAQQAFLANAAHQLKTPLAGLQTQLELAAAEIPDQYRNRVVHLRDATERLAHLAHQLLALARSGPEANISHERRPVELGRLIEDSASNWFDLALARKIDLGFETEPATVEGTAWLLREALANLIDNALRYTPEGGRVTVRSGIDDQGRAYLEVEDNGPGIAPAERQHIFDRFYRAQGTSGPGTGLGLAIVKEVADRHVAIVAVEEAEGAGGTRFRLSFPAAMAAVSQP